MIIRIEALGHVLTITLGKPEDDDDEQDAHPMSNDLPLQVSADEPAEPLGYHPRSESRR